MSNIIYFDDLKKNKYSFSAKLYKKQKTNYVKSYKLKDFLIEPIKKGTEVGSDTYIYNKKYQFIRTSNILNNSVLLDEKSCIGIPKKFFEKQNLKKKQILIVKDGALGNVAFLDRDYPNFMICSGINSLTCKNPFYIFAILQHKLFKKNFEFNVTSGSTISHAKDMYLEFDIPLPVDNAEDIINLVENIMKSIILKERLIKDKINSLNKFISEILHFNGFDNIKTEYPTYSDLLSVKRLDSGYYSEKAIYIRDLIKNYENGYFYIPSKNIKGGKTPKIRSEPSYENLKYKWITPTFINKYGMNTNICSIDFKEKNNINNDTCLIINRTSKKIDGKSGKFVGIASFYNYSFFGKGQHNQGFYRLENYEKIDLIMITTLLNHPIYREYFGEISIGSKMKEIKKYNLTEIPFPKLNSEIKNKIKNLYYKEIKWDYNKDNGNFEEYDNKWSKNAGIFDLYLILYKEKTFLNKIIEKIYNNENIEIKYTLNKDY